MPNISRWRLVVIGTAKLHAGQLVILWVVLAATTYGAFAGLRLAHTWRVAAYEQAIDNENYWRRVDADSCARAALDSVPHGRLAERLEKLRADTFPSSLEYPKTAFFRTRARVDSLRRADARDSLRFVGDSLGLELTAVRASAAELSRIRGDCMTPALTADAPPPARPFKIAFVALAIALACTALASTWVWFGARS